MVKLRRGVQHTTSASAAFTGTNVIVLIDELGPPAKPSDKCNDVPRHLPTMSRDTTFVAGTGFEPATSGL